MLKFSEFTPREKAAAPECRRKRPSLKVKKIAHERDLPDIRLDLASLLNEDVYNGLVEQVAGLTDSLIHHGLVVFFALGKLLRQDIEQTVFFDPFLDLGLVVQK